MKTTILTAILICFAVTAHAALIKQNIEYKQADTVLEGYLVYDDTMLSKRPGIIVVHEWMGLNDYVRSRAEQLAQLGYVAFAADVYGKGIRPTTPEEAGKEAGKYKADRILTRARMTAALEQIKKFEPVDTSKIAVMGYCFGGMAALELARSGADIQGLVSFHGTLAAGDAADATIKPKMLILHGADDPHVKPAEVAEFEQEMQRAGVNYRLIKYPGAVHAFTNPAGTDMKSGAHYDAAADKASWEAMRVFFKDLFGETR